jgi:hypothetical protein
MNLLLDRLPNEYEGLKINTNFRSFILFELLMQDNKVKEEDKIILALNIFYEEPPQDIKKAIDGILWFYRCGDEIKENKANENKTNSKKQIYSYEYDARYIYSAFLDQYGIDLNEIGQLHWFKFKALFEGLKSDNKICEIMSYRAIDLSKIKDKEEKKKYKQLQRQWALPDNRTIEEKEQDFANALW